MNKKELIERIKSLKHGDVWSYGEYQGRSALLFAFKVWLILTIKDDNGTYDYLFNINNPDAGEKIIDIICRSTNINNPTIDLSCSKKIILTHKWF